MTTTLPADKATTTAAPARRQPQTWRELHPDDDPAAEALQFDHWRTASPAVKMRELAALNDMVRHLALEGLRLRYPSASADVRRRMLADLMLGPDLAAAVYGPGGFGESELARRVRAVLAEDGAAE